MIDRTNRLVIAALLGVILGSSFIVLATDGPLTPIANLRGRTDENGYLITKVGGGISGTEYTEGGVFAAASSGSLGLLVRRDTASAGTGVADGDLGVGSMDSAGRLRSRTVLENSSGTELTLSTDVVEDAGETAGVSGPPVMNVRRDVAAASSGTTGDNSTFNTDALGLLWTRFLDPCSGVAKVSVPFSISSPTTTELINGSGASNKAYICAINVVVAAAQALALVEDDTDTCGSPTAGMAGGVTAATGWTFAANGGLTLGNGNGTIAVTSVVNRYVCLMSSTTGQASGNIIYALAP